MQYKRPIGEALYLRPWNMPDCLSYVVRDVNTRSARAIQMRDLRTRSVRQHESRVPADGLARLSLPVLSVVSAGADASGPETTL